MSVHFDEGEGLCENIDEATKGYTFTQTMMRIKDPKASLDFYSRILGMRLVKRFDFPEMKFTLYFLGQFDDETAKTIPEDKSKRATWVFGRETMLELTHNWGSEEDEDLSYHNGNDQPQGFGHIGFTVPDVYAACERFEKLDVPFKKTVDAGKMQGIAFIQDPDGYWIEILQADMLEKRGKDWGLAD